MSSPREIGALGGEPFCRFFALLGARPFPVADADSAANVAREIAGAGETALLLVEEGFAAAAREAVREGERMTLCAIPGPAGQPGRSGGMIDQILTSAIGSHLHEP